METKELYHWNDSPSKFFPLGCPSVATLLLEARQYGDTSGFLLCCYPENPLPPTVAPFLFLTTTFAISAGPHFTKSATSGLHLWGRQLGTEAKNESRKQLLGFASHTPTHCSFSCFHWSLLCRAGTAPKKLVVGPRYPYD